MEAKIDWVELRKKFYRECVVYNESGGLAKFGKFPTEVFDWFMNEIEKNGIHN